MPNIERINGASRDLGAPSEWDQNVSSCDTLPILDVVTDQGPFMISAWSFTPEELEALNKGATLKLWIQGYSHPVVALSVGELELKQ